MSVRQLRHSCDAIFEQKIELGHESNLHPENGRVQEKVGAPGSPRRIRPVAGGRALPFRFGSNSFMFPQWRTSLPNLESPIANSLRACSLAPGSFLPTS